MIAKQVLLAVALTASVASLARAQAKPAAPAPADVRSHAGAG